MADKVVIAPPTIDAFKAAETGSKQILELDGKRTAAYFVLADKDSQDEHISVTFSFSFTDKQDGDGIYAKRFKGGSGTLWIETSKEHDTAFFNSKSSDGSSSANYTVVLLKGSLHEDVLKLAESDSKGSANAQNRAANLLAKAANYLEDNANHFIDGVEDPEQKNEMRMGSEQLAAIGNAIERRRNLFKHQRRMEEIADGITLSESAY